jgi:hypothetical protein
VIIKAGCKSLKDESATAATIEQQTPSRDKESHVKETDVQSTAKVKNRSQQWQPANGSPSNHSHMQEHANAFLPNV